MTFLREFEDDIFISYAHIDNQPLAEGQRGWITSFHQALEIRLSQLLGDRPEFWRDEAKLRGNDYLNDTIILRLPKIAILVTVLTPRYIKSDWCLKEVQEFFRIAEQTGGVRIADKSRVFKIMKTPVPRDKHPPELQDLLGYEFYQFDPTTGKPREFLNSGPHIDVNYWAKLDDLAYDIFQLLETLGSEKPGAARPEPPPRGVVYLAETTLDLTVERDKLKRELQRYGYKVLPEGPLPRDASGLGRVVREDLRRSDLSIHLVGANYGVIPESASSSVVCIQNELAAERGRDPAFSRIIWMPPGLEAQEARQRQFIKSLCDDSRMQQGAELLQTTLEDLKTVVRDTLDGGGRRRAAAPPGPDDSPHRVYLVCDQQDQEDVAPLSDYLFDRGFEVITPLTEGDEAQARADHKENLLFCDSIVIYHGRAGEAWLRSKLFDLRKLAGYGRTRPLSAKAVCVGPPATPEKERFRTLEATVIKGQGGFSAHQREALLAQLETARGAR